MPSSIPVYDSVPLPVTYSVSPYMCKIVPVPVSVPHLHVPVPLSLLSQPPVYYPIVASVSREGVGFAPTRRIFWNLVISFDESASRVMFAGGERSPAISLPPASAIRLPLVLFPLHQRLVSNLRQSESLFRFDLAEKSPNSDLNSI